MSLRPIKNPQTPAWKEALHKKVVQPLRSVGGCLLTLAVVAAPIILPQIVFYYVFDLDDDAPSHEIVRASAATLPTSSTAATGKYHREHSAVSSFETKDNRAQNESEAETQREVSNAASAESLSAVLLAGVPESYMDGSAIRQMEHQALINCAPIGEWSMASSRPSASVNHTVSFVPKNLSSPSAWQSNKSSDEEYRITEEDEEKHNHTYSRYGEGDGTFSTEGSGNDCGEWGGAEYTSSSSVVSATRTANTSAQTPTKEYGATRYWVTSSSGKTHNASCRWYANSKGYYSSSGTGNNCKVCGGAGL